MSENDSTEQKNFSKQLMILPSRIFGNTGAYTGDPNLEMVKCPFCSFANVHIGSSELIDGEDGYKARKIVRGNVHRIPMDGECGHAWYLCFGFHKGATFSWLEERKNMIWDR